MAAQLTPDALNYAVNGMSKTGANLRVLLFVNDLNGAVPDALADFTQASFDGYSVQNATFPAAAVDGNGVAKAQAPAVVFQCNATAFPNVVTGWAVYDDSPGAGAEKILGFEQFAQPFSFTYTGQTLGILVELNAAQQ